MAQLLGSTPLRALGSHEIWSGFGRLLQYFSKLIPANANMKGRQQIRARATASKPNMATIR